MLALQTEHENLFVPDLEVASLTPVHPGRTRVVLADGTVGYRPGPLPAGPWTRLGDSLVTPQLLVQEGNDWKDPAGYRYPYQPLDDLEIEEEPTDLPEGLVTFEGHGRKYFWRTDTGLQPCPYKADQALQLYPQLCQIGRSHLVNLHRVRRFGPRRQGGWVQLDNGERFDFGMRLYHGVAQALGCQTLAFIDREQPPLLLRLRDLPYDLTSADPERIRKDCPTAQSFLYSLLWQTVLTQPNDHGQNLDSYLKHPLQTAAQRCGYQFTRNHLSKALSHLVNEDGLIRLRQLGWSEAHPSRRRVGTTRPQVLLVACHTEARAAAEKWGLSLLLSQFTGDRLCLEYLVAELPSPLHLIFYRVEDKQRQAILLGLHHLEVDHQEPVTLESLDHLEETLQQLVQPTDLPEPVPFRRIALQARRGVLCMVEPHEIAAWSPTRNSRWRVVLADGQVMHHPGPVPPGPWVPLAEHWVQPGLLSNGRDPAGFFLSDQPLPAPPPSAPLPEMPCPVQLTRTLWIDRNRIRITRERSLELDDGQQFPLAPSRHTHRLKQLLGIPAFDQLVADPHGLQLMGLRDFSFEIARAPQALLRQHFPTPHLLLFNTLYQSYDIYQKTGIVPYGNTLSGYYYRPLQAALYRAGFLTRAQWRARRQKPSPKDRLYMLFLRLLHDMVYRHRLFNYREFGFKDPYPEDRLIGNRRPHLVLLVEKGDQVEEFGRRLQAEFGVTLHILQGMPSLMTTEFFAQELKSRGIHQVQILFYGDFDCGGWDMGPVFINQLRFYGIECSGLERLVLPECFTAEELELVSRPIHILNAIWESRVRRWLKQSGGINGQARGIHANFLLPYPRVQSRMEQLLAR